MKAGRVVVALLAVFLLVLSGPLAMASGGCMAMGADCEGPCGVSSCATAGPVMGEIVPPVARVAFGAALGFPSAALDLPDLPPRSILLLA
jgi:hypothetical protein